MTASRAIHERVKYPCGQCVLKATSKGNLDKHNREVHEGVKYPCGQCDHKATSKGNLDQHKRTVHEGLKYTCGQCDYKATRKNNLDRHKRERERERIYFNDSDIMNNNSLFSNLEVFFDKPCLLSI